ncbi:MAG: glutamate 5-kinase [Anaerolineae bacterium]|nr:glutamate 5-kinase [Anaerolineae bacterium]
MNNHQDNNHHTIVVKLGTSTLTGGTPNLSRPQMVEIIRQVVALRELGYRVVIVSSGAIAAGREALDQPNLNNNLPGKQMLSAVGQGYLMQVYSMLFSLYDTHIGQVLLTHADLSHRTRYLNARDTLNTLLDYGIVPIVNENDTVAVDEIKVGDNDNLSAQIAVLLNAAQLIILTDQAGLYDRDPRVDPGAQLIHEVIAIDETILALAGASKSGLGVGGMVTKIQAAQLATRSGTRVIIAEGRTPNVLLRVLAGETLGTTFLPAVGHIESRKRWLLAERPTGHLQIDRGAARVLRQQGASLLPVGVQRLYDDFERGAVVLALDENEQPIAQGLVNYTSAELDQLRGHHSREITDILGYTYGNEAIHRDNMVLM